MYYGEIKKTDIANGQGVRVTLFVSGCRHRCKNCFNPETWSFTYGQPFTEQTAQEIEQALAPAFINGLTVLGGEPMEPENQGEILAFLQRIRANCPGKTIWLYTGCILEQELWQEGSTYRTAATDKLLQQLDVLVDGPFLEEQKDITLLFRGSANQRLIDMKKTLASGTVVLWEE